MPNKDRVPFYGMLGFVFALAVAGGAIAITAIHDMNRASTLSDASKPAAVPKL